MMIESDSRLLASFYIKRSEQQKLSWNTSLEILYVLEGTGTFQVKKQTLFLKEQQLLVINPYEMYSYYGEKLVLLRVCLNVNQLGRSLKENPAKRIECHSLLVKDEKELLPIKLFIKRIVENEIDKNPLSELENQILAYSLWQELLLKFGDGEAKETERYDIGFQKIGGILEYMNAHYQEKLTLTRMSEISFLTRAYFSKMFKRYTGMNFSECLVNLRLNYAVQDVIYTKDDFELISARHGFPNARAFSNAFRDKYGMLPSAYRKKIRSRKSEDIIVSEGEESEYLKKLTEQLQGNEIIYQKQPRTETFQAKLPPVSAKEKGLSLEHRQWKFINAGAAGELLSQAMQAQVRDVQRHLGFVYAGIDDIFNEELGLYIPGKEASFYRMDQVLDFIVNEKLIPWIILGGMSCKAMSEVDSKAVSEKEADCKDMPEEEANCKAVSEEEVDCKDMPEEEANCKAVSEEKVGRQGVEQEAAAGKRQVLQAAICHWKKRYGKDSVKRWIFDSVEGETMEILKKEGLMTAGNIWEGTWEEEKIPDIFTFHAPVHKSAFEESENGLKEWIYDEKRWIKEHQYSEKAQFLTRWRPFPQGRNPLYDTAYYACYMVKNILENYDRTYGMGFMKLSDLPLTDKGEFQGSDGLLTRSGLRKPAFYSLLLLKRLGDVVIARGDGYFVTSSSQGMQILLYNYYHFSPLALAGGISLDTMDDACQLFDKEGRKRVVIPLEDLEAQTFLVTDTFINGNYGSARDMWKRNGAVDLWSREDIAYFNSASLPGRERQILEAEQGKMMLVRDLEPHEVRLIELEDR